MSQNSIDQRNVTRNQSTVDFQHKNIFVFDNRYEEGIFKNNSGAELTTKPFKLVAREVGVVGGLIPVIAGNLADVIGISTETTENTMAIGATMNINYCTKGTIAEGMIGLPDGVTLDTTVGTKALRDVLEGLGFHLEKGIENTKFDN